MNDQSEAPERRIVVGVDGSPHSKTALRWAMLLGSVSQHCVQHAPCPVLVVPQDTTPSQ